ncbi:polymer-forming cytoskeletal protein [Trinickia acidisoli]|uniref:polymer-forming cytoskeletal protein n=1 Tax=Trinickia acidisoli TaxID=2767482 RepID=UPI001A8CB4B2|nr:polymer-forming cytoskeletal protein [Trinickia acidisoli]
MSTNPISRVAYFSGEALLTADFQDEQKYHKEMRERLSQGLLTPGILKGLDIEWSHGDSQVTVRAGTALDSQGQLIALTEDTPYAPSPLVDGKQNFLTISYDEVQDRLVQNTYGQGYKRWVETNRIECTQDYDPNGPAILLAVIGASGGAIQSIYYCYGQYMRRHVSAVLRSVEFVGPNADGVQSLPLSDVPPPSMSIGATEQGTLEIEAPVIELSGAVTADSMTAAGSFMGTFDGSFKGTFEGDGSQLNLPSTNYWTRNNADDSLFYMGGNVGVNDNQPSAVLSVGQPMHSLIGIGLVTAVSAENGVVTLQGYQTNFTQDLAGKILQFGVVLKQEAKIASVESDDGLTLEASFPLGLGPTKYGYVSVSSGAKDEAPGTGLITPDGNTVRGSGGTQFQSQAKLQSGDVLVIDRFVPQQKVIESKIAPPVTSDTALTLTQAFSENVTNSGYMYSTEPGRWTTGAGTITSNGTQVTGAGTTFTKLPDGATLRAEIALDVASAPQTWRVDSVTDPTHLTMHKISIDDGTPLLPMMSSFVQTSWPLMQVGGGTQPSLPPALTVVQNNGNVPNTVAINVDDSAVKIDSNYALQVNGPISFAGALDVDGALDVKGDVTIEGRLDVKRDSMFEGELEVKGDSTLDGALNVKGDSTLQGQLEVKGNVTLDGTLDGGGQKVVVAHDLEVKGASTLDGTLEVKGASTLDGTLGVKGASTLDGTLEVKGTSTLDGTLEVKGASTLDGTLDVKGDSTLEGALQVKGQTATFGHDVVVEGNLTVQGQIISTKSGSVFGAPETIYNSAVGTAQNQGGPIPCFSHSASSDGMFILTTDNVNSGDYISGGSHNFFYYTFEVKVNGSAGVASYYSSAFETSYHTKGGPGAAGSAFISVPVSEGDAIDVQYYQQGVVNKSFNLIVRFTPFAG